MKKINKILLSLSAFAIGFCAVAVLGGNVFVEARGANKLNNCSMTENSFVKPSFPTNENGQTYGETYNVMIEDYPDLIGVIAANGKEGYVYKNEFTDEYIPQSPEEAVEYMNVLKELNDRGIYFQVITVYEADGETVIGEFEKCIDVGLSFDQAVNAEEIEEIIEEREKLYEESRIKGNYLREDIETVMMRAKGI